MGNDKNQIREIIIKKKKKKSLVLGKRKRGVERIKREKKKRQSVHIIDFLFDEVNKFDFFK